MVDYKDMKRSDAFLTTPMAIILGAVLISVSILISGGIIKLGPKTSTVAGVQTTASPIPQPPAVTLDTVKNVFGKSVIKFGDSGKKLVAVEVADPSCPFCHIAAGKNPELNKQADPKFVLVADGGPYVAPVPELEKLAKEGKAAFAWIYTPGHGNGEMATKALYCAFEKNKFWEVHDMLMSKEGYDLLNSKIRNDKTKSQDLADFLSPVFDPSAMKACLDSGKYDNRLKEDVSLAQSLGVTGTPGFYLNATLFGGAYNYKDMEPAVKQALGT